MHRFRVAALAIVAGATPAWADDPHDLFGVGGGTEGPKPIAPPPACDDGTAVGCAGASDDLDAVSPATVRTWLSRGYLLSLPIADARHDAVAGYLAGANRDEAGPAFGGVTGLENRWTIGGAPADSIRTGGIDIRVPVTFLDGMRVTAGGFSARDRVSTGGMIDAELRGGTAHHVLEAYAWGGYTTDATHRPVASGTYSVRRGFADAAPDYTLSLVATGPITHGAWYAAGVAPTLAPIDYTFAAKRIVDEDGDGVPDGLPGDVVTQPIETTHTRSQDFSIPAFARVGLTHGVHAVDVTLVGQADRAGAFLGNATPDTAIERDTYSALASATWQGTWKHTRARAQFAWQRSHRDDDPRTAGGAQMQFLSAYVPATLADDPDLATACADASTALTDCPVPFGFFASGGAGLLVTQTGDRPSATVDVTHARGVHTLRAGATAEDARLVTTQAYSGGALVRSLFDGHTDTLHFVDGACDPAGDCATATSQTLTYRTRYAAGYVEDTITPVPGLRLDAGLRYELMEVGTALDFDHELAPRFSFAYDFLGGGAARAWASYARTYAVLPTGIGTTLLASERTVRDIHSPLGDSRLIDSGAPLAVADGIEPLAQDEGTAGLAVGQPGIAQASVWAEGRSLRRGLETVSVSRDDLTVNFDNPGRTGTMPPARRDTLVVAAEVTVIPTVTSSVRAGYAFTRAVGTWTGPFDPRQGANLYAGTDFDLDRSNLAGRLPTDAAHRLFIEAARQWHRHGIDFGGSLRGTVSSGRPQSVVADTDQGLVYLLPRGTYGRAPMVSQLNIRLAARWRGADVTLDLFNIFDHRAPSNLDEGYAGITTRPIVGGTASDLVFLKYESGDIALRRTAFHIPSAYQPPFGVTLGIHRAF